MNYSMSSRVPIQPVAVQRLVWNGSKPESGLSAILFEPLRSKIQLQILVQNTKNSIGTSKKSRRAATKKRDEKSELPKGHTDFMDEEKILRNVCCVSSPVRLSTASWLPRHMISNSP